MAVSSPAPRVSDDAPSHTTRPNRKINPECPAPPLLNRYQITWGMPLLDKANIYSLTLEFSVLHSTSPGARATMFWNAIRRNPSGFTSARLLHRSVAVEVCEHPGFRQRALCCARDALSKFDAVGLETVGSRVQAGRPEARRR